MPKGSAEIDVKLQALMHVKQRNTLYEVLLKNAAKVVLQCTMDVNHFVHAVTNILMSNKIKRRADFIINLYIVQVFVSFCPEEERGDRAPLYPALLSSPLTSQASL